MIGNKGFTLVELIVAVSIFSIAVSSLSALFVAGLRGSRSAIAQQNVLDNTRFALEHMARQIRMATRDETGACTGVTSDRVTFKASVSTLTFFDYHAVPKCVRYELSGGKILIFPDMASQPLVSREITSSDIVITRLDFLALGVTATDGEQPRITVSLEAEAGANPETLTKVQLQTTISARNLDVP